MAGWLFVQLSLHLLTRSWACADPRELKWNCKALVLLCLKEKKNQKSPSACNLHNSFPADIDRVFIKPITFFSFLSFLFFSFCEYVLFADCPECKQYILKDDPQSTTHKEGYDASCEESQKIGKPYTTGPFIRGKIRRVLHKTRTFRVNGTFRLK